MTYEDWEKRTITLASVKYGIEEDVVLSYDPYKYWEEGLYDRKYLDLSSNTNVIKTPSEKQLQEIYTQMDKHNDEDHLNCSSCGYDSCEIMATAI